MSAHTPGPWVVEPIPADAHTDPDLRLSDDYVFWIAESQERGEVLAVVEKNSHGNAEANAHLIAAAPNHALFARALINGVIRWEFFKGSTTDGEICCGGLRYTSEVDEFGVPRIHEIHRQAIAKAERAK